MTAILSDTTQASTFAQRFGAEAPSQTVRALTRTLIGAVPRTIASVRSLRADVMGGMKRRPIAQLLTLCYAAIDAGVSVEKVTQWCRDFIAAVEAYAARREKRTTGVLPFQQVHVRLTLSAIREDAEADSAEALMNCDDISSLENARAERLQAIEAEERKVEAITHRIAFLRAR